MAVVFLPMNRLPLLGLIAITVAACAPPVTRPIPQPLPAANGQPMMLPEGPDGESPAPPGSPSASAAKAARPALATAVSVPSARMAAALTLLREKEIAIPVAGVGSARIEDTFTAARDGGERQHNAVDILAPLNTPVLAADDGVVLRLSTNTLGGITIYATDKDQAFVYYYAHLDHYQRDLAVGQSIAKGDTIGFVGTTGNAPKNVPHLHFQIMLWPADGRWWNGEPINPYPFLRGTATRDKTRLD